MGRDRHQQGWVEETGKKRKRWRGHYFIYERQADGSEIRRHRSIVLGNRSELTKTEAKKKLISIIARVTDSAAIVPSEDVTLEWFWRQRYLPLKRETWKESSRYSTIFNIERYIISRIGQIPLAKLDKFTLQLQVNQLSKEFSKSVVDQFITYTKAVLEEAVDQEFIGKNPARKLEWPETKSVCKKVLKIDEISALFSLLSQREQLIMSLSLVLGLRPGELFALRRNDVTPDGLRIDEATRNGRVYRPKTKSSKAFVWIPESIRVRLNEWLKQVPEDPEAFLFPNTRGGVERLSNYRRRVLGPIYGKLMELGIKGITFQACRRTCGTYLQMHAGVKDIQSHLRHADASTTMKEYVQEIPESVRAAVESLDAQLLIPTTGVSPVVDTVSVLNRFEPHFSPKG